MFKILFAARRQQSKMLLILVIAAYLTIYCVALVSPQSNSWSAHSPKPPEDLLRLWIDRQQVKMFSGKETRKKHFIYLYTYTSLALFSEQQSLLTIFFPLFELQRGAPTHSNARSCYTFALPKLFEIFASSPLISIFKWIFFLSTQAFLWIFTPFEMS